MKYIALLCLIANVALLAYGQGFFGVQPSEYGRSISPAPFVNEEAVTVGSALSLS